MPRLEVLAFLVTTLESAALSVAFDVAAARRNRGASKTG
jgi:hypothetical protein